MVRLCVSGASVGFAGTEWWDPQRTLCFARRRTVTLAIVSRKVAGSPGVLKTCAFGLGTRSVSRLLNEGVRITKMRENCLKQFDEHWNCLETNNQVSYKLNIRIITPIAHVICAGLLPV
jgi:hypothetical protein